MKIILTTPGNGGIRLTGDRGMLTVEDRQREYVQVTLEGPTPWLFHVGWVRVEDLANVVDGGSAP